jgi:hypothetical protein
MAVFANYPRVQVAVGEPHAAAQLLNDGLLLSTHKQRPHFGQPVQAQEEFDPFVGVPGRLTAVCGKPSSYLQCFSSFP